MLITLQQLKDYLKITSPQYDELLTSSIEQASSFIEDYCNRRFEQADYDLRLDGHGEDEYILPYFPVNSLTSFQYNKGTIGVPVWEDYSVDSYYADSETGIISTTFSVHKGIKNIHVVFNAGYENIPADLQRACIRIATYIYSGSGKLKQGVKRERVDGAEIEYDTTTQAIETEIYSIMNKYKKYV